MGTDLLTVRVGLEPSTLAGNDREEELMTQHLATPDRRRPTRARTALTGLGVLLGLALTGCGDPDGGGGGYVAQQAPADAPAR